MVWRAILALTVLLLGATASAQDCPARIRIAFNEMPSEPLLYGRGPGFADPPGLAVQAMQQALRHLGCLERAEWQRLPFARMLLLAQPGVAQLDLVAGVAEGSPNTQALVLPPPAGDADHDLSVGTTSYSLYARAADAGAWNGRQLSLKPGQRVGLLRGSAADHMARERGWPTEPAHSFESAFQMLVAGRTAFLYAHDASMAARAHPELVRLSPAVQTRRYHVAASQDFYAREALFMQRLWVEMCLQGNLWRDKPQKCLAPPKP